MMMMMMNSTAAEPCLRIASITSPAGRRTPPPSALRFLPALLPLPPAPLLFRALLEGFDADGDPAAAAACC
jgi:hypothetical protein